MVEGVDRSSSIPAASSSVGLCELCRGPTSGFKRVNSSRVGVPTFILAKKKRVRRADGRINVRTKGRAGSRTRSTCLEGLLDEEGEGWGARVFLLAEETREREMGIIRQRPTCFCLCWDQGGHEKGIVGEAAAQAEHPPANQQPSLISAN